MSTHTQPTAPPPRPGSDSSSSRGLTNSQHRLDSSSSRGLANSQHKLELDMSSTSYKKPLASERNSATPSPPNSGSPRTSEGMGDAARRPVGAGSSNGDQAPSSRRSNRSEMEISQDLTAMSLDPVLKQGSFGQRVQLAANHLVLSKVGDSEVFFYQYHVKFEPEVDNMSFRHRLVGTHRETLGKHRFDGSTIFSPKKLPTNPLILQAKRETDGQPHVLTVTFTRELKAQDPETIRIYNLMFQRIMNIMRFQVDKKSGKSFDSSHPIKIPQHKVEIWPGYITSVSPLDGGLRLLCDVSHKVIRTQSVLQYILELKNRVSNEEMKRLLANDVVGFTVMTPYNKKNYRVDEIEWEKTPADTTFDTKEGTINLCQYYQTHYDITITEPKQPLLVHYDKKKRDAEAPPMTIYLVPELCQMTGLSDKMREDFKVMKDVAEHTRVNPMNRVRAMERFVHTVKNSPEARDELGAWGLQLAETPCQITGRNILDRDVVLLGKGGSQKQVLDHKVDFGMALGRNQCITSPPLTNWLVIHPARDRSGLQNFVDTFEKFVPQLLNHPPQPPKVIPLQSDRADDYLKAISANLTAEVQMIVFIMSTKVEQKYNSIKRQCCAITPVPSQCIISRTLGNDSKRRRIVQNIALQMVAKMGGELWGVEIPTPQLVGRLMVVGVDVYHEASKKGKSVVAICCALNQNCTRYYSSCQFQTPGLEIGGFYKIPFEKSLYKYKELHGALPDRVLVYRDGVGDGQMRQVQQNELPQLVAACNSVEAGYNPAFTFIICQKRINARIFEKIRGQIDNPRPGTVVDSEITRRGYTDFFLVSQHVRQGTVTPTHYIVLKNDPGTDANKRLSNDNIQRLTFRLTFLYYNWPGSIRVPAPCQYAHKLAQLAGLNVGEIPKESLNDKLFFL
jgi:aubergine-like protein